MRQARLIRLLIAVTVYALWAPANAAKLTDSIAVAQAKNPSAGAGAPSPTVGEGGADAAPRPSPWSVSCSDRVQNKFQCEMSQTLIEKGSNTPLVTIIIRRSSDGASDVALIRVIHGVYLPTGIALKVDSGTARPLAFQKSDQSGVYAALPLNQATLAELSKGHELKVGVQLNKDQPLELAASLAGFGPAFERLSAASGTTKSR